MKQNMKIRIKNAEHSKQVQDALFKLGYYWDCGCMYKYTNYKFLFIYSYGNSITHGTEEIYFKNHSNKEFFLTAMGELMEVKEYPNNNNKIKDVNVVVNISVSPDDLRKIVREVVAEELSKERTVTFRYNTGL